MAGGKGKRMEPFTKVLPKPLIPINDKTVIEHIIDRFQLFGCENFYLTVNYKSKILKAYFEELDLTYNINFVTEDIPLGTIGSLSFLKKEIKNSFFVTNCDCIVKADYQSIYNFHQSNNYDLTLVASAKEYVIPYGTCELNDNGSLSKINEKPKYNFLINTGFYVLNANLIQLIPDNKFYHITDLISDLRRRKMRVGVYPVYDSSWLDVGQWHEYKQSVKMLL